MSVSNGFSFISKTMQQNMFLNEEYSSSTSNLVTVQPTNGNQNDMDFNVENQNAKRVKFRIARPKRHPLLFNETLPSTIQEKDMLLLENTSQEDILTNVESVQFTSTPLQPKFIVVKTLPFQKLQNMNSTILRDELISTNFQNCAILNNQVIKEQSLPVLSKQNHSNTFQSEFQKSLKMNASKKQYNIILPTSIEDDFRDTNGSNEDVKLVNQTNPNKQKVIVQQVETLISPDSKTNTEIINHTEETILPFNNEIDIIAVRKKENSSELNQIQPEAYINQPSVVFESEPEMTDLICKKEEQHTDFGEEINNLQFVNTELPEYNDQTNNFNSTDESYLEEYPSLQEELFGNMETEDTDTVCINQTNNIELEEEAGNLPAPGPHMTVTMDESKNLIVTIQSRKTIHRKLPPDEVEDFVKSDMDHPERRMQYWEKSQLKIEALKQAEKHYKSKINAQRVKIRKLSLRLHNLKSNISNQVKQYI